VSTAIAIVLLCVIASLVILVILVSLQFFKALQLVAQNSDRAHDRSMRLLADTQDRFMAVDFESFKAMQLTASAEEGYVEEQPLPEATIEQEEPSLHRRWFTSPDSEANTVVIPPEEMEDIERRERAREVR
jgi:hypothetical protein